MTATMTRSPARILTGLASLLTLTLLIAGTPTLLVVMGAYPHGVPDPARLWAVLTTPDDGTVLRGVLAAIVWALWAYFTAAVAHETYAQLAARTQLHPRHPPGPAAVSVPVARLVQATLALFIAVPTLLTTTTVPARAATPVTISAPPAPTATIGADAGARGGEQTRAARPSRTGRPPAPTAVVHRHDTLWRIAAQRLRDPERWPEIRDLNRDTLHGGTTIRRGQILRLPADATPTTGGPATADVQVTVRPGDTLSEIAADHGVPDWPAVYAANRDRTQPHGERLTDPDHIEPGWTITIPQQHANGVRTRTATETPSRPNPADAPGHPTTPRPEPTGTSMATPTPTSGSTPASESTSRPTPAYGLLTPTRVTTGYSPAGTTPSANPSAIPANDPQASGAAETGVDYRIAAPAGALFTGGVLAAFLLLRRRQWRCRRPGRTIATTPPHLIPVEQHLVTHGPAGIVDAARLDNALRGLAGALDPTPGSDLPDVLAVRMTPGDIQLHLATPLTTAPSPWVADDGGRTWTLPATAPTPPTDPNQPAPYPALVTIGADNTGARWLLDLERAGSLQITGPTDQVTDLARFLAAELAVNTWSDPLNVTLVGFGEECVGLAPHRVRHHTSLDTVIADLERAAHMMSEHTASTGVDPLHGRIGIDCADTWFPHIVIVGPGTAAPAKGLTPLMDLLRAQRRSALAIVLASPDGGVPTHTTLALAGDGTLTVTPLAVTLTAEALTDTESRGLADLLHVADDEADIPMPAATGNHPWTPYAEADGRLRPAYTRPRHTGPPEAEASNLLPEPDEVYLQYAATTSDDLALLAPDVPPETTTAVYAADPNLDRDLADWHDPACARPRLSLLGPLRFRPGHDGVRPPKRPAYYTEIITYLATRPNGATRDEIAAAFGLQPSRVRTDLGLVRAWLGTDPVTGQPVLPEALRSAEAHTRGIGVYLIEKALLVDADLFHRLRLRGQARGGTEGIHDLSLALELVSGEPFSQMRPESGLWLTDGDRIDQHLTASIIDIAHTVATAALADGDTPTAQAAAERALLAAPYDDTPRLDLAATFAPPDNPTGANDYLRRQILNLDDETTGDDLPERTETVIHHRRWLKRASAS